MNVLVTGGTGFLGLYIVEALLARGEKVRVLARRSIPEIHRVGIDFVSGDLRSRETVFAACRKMDAVIHTAAIAGISPHYKPFYEINVLGTQNVIDGCLAAGVKKLVSTGSPSAADHGKPQLGVDETVPYPAKYLCYYPQTKAAAERLVLAANGTPLADGSGVLATCSLRPRLIWGPRDRQLIPRLIDRARRRRLCRVGDGKNLLDITYVENAANAHLQAMDALSPESPVSGNAYYLSQGEPVNCWDWIDRVLSMAGLPPITRKISFSTAWRVGGICEMLYRVLPLRGEPPMTRFLATQLAQSYWFDISKAKRDFGYSPQISTEEGLRRLEIDLKKRFTP